MVDIDSLRGEQHRIASAMTAAHEMRQFDTVDSLHPEYRSTVDRLTAALGPNAFCGMVDILLWRAYADEYQSRNGRVPACAVTSHAAKQFIKESQS